MRNETTVSVYDDNEISRETLKELLLQYQEEVSKCFQINTIEGKRRLRFSSIMYVERSGQSLQITMNDGKLYESVTLRESFAHKLEPLLKDARFVQTHVSFLVNLDAIDVYQRDQLVMRDGREIPISRRYVSHVKERYYTYCC